MKISKSRSRKRRGDSSACSNWPDCSPACDCGDCNLTLIGPALVGLLGMLAVRTPSRPPRPRPGAAGRAGMAAIRGYQRWLSPRLPTRCRHRPTCSEYGLTAVRRYGLVTGTRLTAGRIRRCDSGTPRGTVDQVP